MSSRPRRWWLHWLRRNADQVAIATGHGTALAPLTVRSAYCPEKWKENIVSLDLMKEKGVPIEQQTFDWREIVGAPTSKLNDDAFTRVRIILMNGVESEALRFQHACA